ncbi:pyrroline-5-carboxylate reductase 3-like [Liolophura sinensis]|uniref:pyrroline-5-carboxylate reductase 3-like n=1 Tax=Liolophura sinensis TaxID=3198878 RepID=UPI003158E36E
MASEKPSKLPDDITLGFIGAGKMGKAICGGLINAGMVKPRNISVHDRNTNMLDSIRGLGVTIAKDNGDVVRRSQFVILAVKPHIVPIVLKEINRVVEPNNLIVSIAAGVTIATIENLLPAKTRVIRVMPNTPALVQTGAAYVSPGTSVKEGDVDLVAEIFSSVGICEVGREELLDAITGLSGSGPAYIYAAIEAMADGGVKMGLPRDMAQRLAAQTAMGAAKMVLETGKHPGLLKDEVCSPGGTTIAAMHRLEKGGFRGALIDAIEAATLRSQELGTKSPGE